MMEILIQLHAYHQLQQLHSGTRTEVYQSIERRIDNLTLWYTDGQEIFGTDGNGWRYYAAGCRIVYEISWIPPRITILDISLSTHIDS